MPHTFEAVVFLSGFFFSTQLEGEGEGENGGTYDISSEVAIRQTRAC